jgi:hypothetical protein
VLQDDSDYDSAGYQSQAKTALGWSIELTVQRKVTAALATAYDPGQELLRAAANALGTTGVVDVRWYEVTASGPITEAYRGYAEVTWAPEGGAMDALDTASLVLTGRGARATYTHPDFAAAVPILYSVTPAVGVQAGGTLHTLKGQNFFAAGVSGVVSMAVGVTAITVYTVDDDQTIHFVMPAKAAATFAITVTNATGVSTVTVNIVIT